MKRLNIAIDDDLHKQLKSDAALNGCTITQYVISAITEKIESSKDDKKQDKNEEA